MLQSWLPQNRLWQSKHFAQHIKPKNFRTDRDNLLSVLFNNYHKSPLPVLCSIFALSEKEREELHIDQLPGTLLEAVEELEKDTFIQKVLGDHIAGKYIDAKRKEWHEYRSQVSEWEIQEYLYKY